MDPVIVRRKLPLAALLLSFAALHAAPAVASVTQESIFQDDNQLKANPAGTMQILRDLGVQRVRVNLTWNTVAPSPDLDQAARRASMPTRPGRLSGGGLGAVRRDRPGRPDLWRRDRLHDQRPRPPVGDRLGRAQGTTGYFRAAWQPSAKEFGLFVRAVGTRYSGSYKPRGSSTALPRVNFWSIWNEPNYGYDIAPQGIGSHQSTPNSPHVYRNLLNAAWSSLQATGHRTRTDRILFGEVTPHGVNAWGVFSDMKPLIFLRSLYCVDSRYRELRGSTAAAQGCPTTAAASRNFRKQNPALFSASGFADHPYEQASAPNRPTHLCGTKLCVGRPSDPDFADLPQIPNLERTLDRLNCVYGSRTQLPGLEHRVWLPDQAARPEPRRQPEHRRGLHELGEYLSYRQPRLYSYSQYQLIDNAAAGLLRHRPREPERQPQAGLRRLPHAAVPPDHEHTGRPKGRDLGRRRAPPATPGSTPARPRACRSSSSAGRAARGRPSTRWRSRTRRATSTCIWPSPRAARSGWPGPIRPAIRCSAAARSTAGRSSVTVK